jgi:predicted RNA-binding Zn ribbon-like protein
MYGAISLDFLAGSRLAEDFGLGRQLVALGILSFEPSIRPEDAADGDRLRRALERIFTNASRGEALPPRDLETLNSYASEELPLVVLQLDGGAVRTATDPVRSGLAALARDGIETVARHATRLRACAGEGCGRLFLDRSRASRRRWCSMGACGNRIKVAAFRRRRTKPEASPSGS